MIDSTQPEAAPLAVEADRRGQILIVDDDTDQAYVLARALERNGFAVAIELEGHAALQRASADPPDLVLLDLYLPDMDGLQVCRELVDGPETCGVPVIVVSGTDNTDAVRACRTAGGEFFVRKPYDPNVLLALIEQTLADW